MKYTKEELETLRVDEKDDREKVIEFIKNFTPTADQLFEPYPYYDFYIIPPFKPGVTEYIENEIDIIQQDLSYKTINRVYKELGLPKDLKKIDDSNLLVLWDKLLYVADYELNHFNYNFYTRVDNYDTYTSSDRLEDLVDVNYIYEIFYK